MRGNLLKVMLALGGSGLVAAGLLGLAPRVGAELRPESLLAAYVPATEFQPTSSATLVAASLTQVGTADSLLPPKGLRLSEGQRWVRFEKDFGIHEKDSSLVGGTLQLAKYRLDQAAFAMDDLAGNIQDALAFDYDFGRASSGDRTSSTSRLYFSPVRDLFENVRLKSDIDLNASRQRAFIGVRLVFPFGN